MSPRPIAGRWTTLTAPDCRAIPTIFVLVHTIPRTQQGSSRHRQNLVVGSMPREVFGTRPKQIRGWLDRSNAFYCSFLIASLFMPPFLIASIVSRVIARKASSEVPFIIGLRGFKQMTVEADMSNGIYRQLSLRGRVITLFDRKRIVEAREGRFLAAGVAEPTPRAILNYGLATAIACVTLSGSYYLGLGFPYSMLRYDFWFDVIALGFLSYWMLKLEAENLSSGVRPLVAGVSVFYALIEEHPFLAISMCLIAITIVKKVLHRWYKYSAGVIESEEDLRRLSQDLAGPPPLRGGAFFPIGFGVRANLYDNHRQSGQRVRLTCQIRLRVGTSTTRCTPPSIMAASPRKRTWTLTRQPRPDAAGRASFREQDTAGTDSLPAARSDLCSAIGRNRH
jgi:hypothetical protein